MTDLPHIAVADPDLEKVKDLEGRLAILIPDDGRLDPVSRRVNRLTKGAVVRFVESQDFARMKEGEAHTLSYPTGLSVKAVDIVKLERRTRGTIARRAGASIGARSGSDEITLAAGSFRGLTDVCLGLLLRLYRFTDHLTGDDDWAPAPPITVMTPKRDDLLEGLGNVRPLADGVYFTRDLVNEPSNVLTTSEFARRLVALSDLGVDVQVFEEDELEKLGMRTLLAVGQGSPSPSKMVVLHWRGSDESVPPVALIGKGVVFDTGGISMKPARGMENMTMDMAGAGAVAGVMRSLALRKSKAHVVGLVGLVENMPDGDAVRPGDVVRSMKGDTVEIVNTDAEGRLVLADLLWYAAERFQPKALVNLATLTGAIVAALGKHKAGLFCNDDALAKALTSAASSEDEGLWRMPLGAEYAEQLKSRVADLKNSGTQGGGAVAAAEFLRRFVKDDIPWAHLDIAGVATVNSDTKLTPKGATGWGVLSLDRWIADTYEDQS